MWVVVHLDTYDCEWGGTITEVYGPYATEKEAKDEEKRLERLCLFATQFEARPLVKVEI